MSVLHFISMYMLMYSMVNVFGNIFPNLNNAYMAGLMTAPMLIIESILMGSMYKDKKALKIIGAAGLGLLIIGFVFIRQQTLIYDKEFIRSMIPHHAGAILMCDKSKLKDRELQELCQQITLSQQSEINQMKSILKRLE